MLNNSMDASLAGGFGVGNAPQGRQPLDGHSEGMQEFEDLNLECVYLATSLPLTDEEMAAAQERYLHLKVPVGGTRVRGGLASVMKVTNSDGEVFCLKTPNYIGRTSARSKAELNHYLAAERKAFETEFKNQWALDQLNGFPRLYAMGRDKEGYDYIVMEWVNGKTLESALPIFAQMAGDGHRKVSPLIVSQFALSLFKLISQFNELVGGFVHRDISLRNIMLRTDKYSVEEQIRRGSYDLCILDFGSGTQVEEGFDPSLTAVDHIRRNATPDYASPEMLAQDLPNLYELRKSIKIDVYAISSVLYQMVAGTTPYRLDKYKAESGSLYRFKVDHECDLDFAPPTTHANMVQVAQLDGEPGLFELARSISAEQGIDERRFMSAVNRVDGQLGVVLRRGLCANQDKRADIAEMQELLMRFFSQYLSNVEAVYRGKPMEPVIPPVHRMVSQAGQQGQAGPQSQEWPYAAQRNAYPQAAPVMQPLRPVPQFYVAPLRTQQSMQWTQPPDVEDSDGSTRRIALWTLGIVLVLAGAFVAAELLGGIDMKLSIGAVDYQATLPAAVLFLVCLLPSLCSLPFYLCFKRGSASFFAGSVVLSILDVLLWRVCVAASWTNPAVVPVASLILCATLVCFVICAFFATLRK